MKICFVITDAISFNYLCDDLLKSYSQDPSVDLTLVCGGSNDDLDVLRSKSYGNVIDVGFSRSISLANDFASLRKLLKVFNKVKYDLVVVSTPKALLLGSVASFLGRQPARVAIVRGRVYENKSGFSRKAWLLLDVISFKCVHKVIFISRSLMHAYNNDGINNTSKFKLLGEGSSAGVDLSRFTDRYFREKYSKAISDREVFNIVLVGRLCKDKGYYELPEIARRVSNRSVRFLLYGSIEDKLLMNQLEELMLTDDRVQYMGHADSVEDVFHNADMHLFLSFREGFGNVAIEAAAAGVPTIAFDVVGVKDSVIDGITGMKFPRDSLDKLSDYIEWCVTYRKEYAANYSQCRECVAKRFDRRIVNSMYIEYFRNLITRYKR